MKYLEEITSGDFFTYDNKVFLLTSDFKKNGARMAINTIDGFPLWLNGNTIVETTILYKLDAENNVIAIKNDNTEINSIPQISSLAH